MKISVCMATYNGAAYVKQQLQSIQCQSLPPDEVIICDDGSTDGTIRIIQGFIRGNCLQDTWKLYQNEQNKGYPGNFYYAMSLCSGDIVFLADQDDIWHEEKLAHMCRAFKEHPKTLAVSCKLSLIDAQGSDIHSVMAPTHGGSGAGQGSLRKVSIEDVFYKCEWPGMVLAYRRQWQQGLHQSFRGIPHDFLICARAAEEGGFYQLDEILAYHRRHDNNTGGEEHRLSRLLQKERKLQEIRDYLQILQSFEEEEALQTEHGKAALNKKTSSMQGRYEALQSGKLRLVLRNAWRHRAETRIKTLLCDVVIVLKE